MDVIEEDSETPLENFRKVAQSNKYIFEDYLFRRVKIGIRFKFEDKNINVADIDPMPPLEGQYNMQISSAENLKTLFKNCEKRIDNLNPIPEKKKCDTDTYTVAAQIVPVVSASAVSSDQVDPNIAVADARVVHIATSKVGNLVVISMTLTNTCCFRNFPNGITIHFKVFKHNKNYQKSIQYLSQLLLKVLVDVAILYPWLLVEVLQWIAHHHLPQHHQHQQQVNIYKAK